MATYLEKKQQKLNEYAEKSEQRINDRVMRYYETEFKRLQKEIEAYYAEYGMKGVVEYRTLLQELPQEDIDLLIKRQNEFVQKYPEYADLLPIRNSIYKLNRLEGLQYSVVLNMAENAGWTNEQVKPYLDELAKRSANNAMETLGFGANYYKENDSIVQEFVDAPWINGKNYTTRIWENLQKDATKINNLIASGVARGDSVQKMVNELKRYFVGVPSRQIKQLVMTEATYVLNQTAKKVFEQDFDGYTYKAVMDKKTCSVCRALNGKWFRFDEAEPGVNYPPMHTRCRCLVSPYVEDWDAWIDGYVEKHGGDGARAERIRKRIEYA